MRVYLVQHAEALPESVDPARRLSDKGREEVSRVAAFLAASGVQVARIRYSGKARARETAEILAAALGAAMPGEAMPGLAPNDPVEPVRAEVVRWEEDTMLVGHLPFMARLASLLTAGRDDPPFFAFQPGSVVCLEREEEAVWWWPGCCGRSCSRAGAGMSAGSLVLPVRGV